MQDENRVKEESRRHKAIQVKQQLDEQVALAKQKGKSDAALTDPEKLLNKSLIHRIEEDKGFYKKVADKVAPPHVGGGLGFSWG